MRKRALQLFCALLPAVFATLVLGAAEDKIVTAKASEEIAERIGCPIHIYEDLGHAAYEEAPDFNKRIYDFLMQP